ncbi:uncharacterized protein LOC125164466 isoform X3 [Prionailurus viverrinus]|uniref:uncharacterized protein LOC125164466 isoform X3 n=1 Tax=Prionailurus viverrinus TaxID=61388 RepID=UPI001FF55599|nr:uncharacterized protein LOC125164466 isoform X3 [Prionailurus viverrinus]
MSQLSPSAFSFHEESVPAAATGRDACVLDERCVEPAYRPGKRPHSQKESLQVSASSGEMQVRPQNCTVAAGLFSGERREKGRRVLLGPYCFPENQAGFPSQGPTRITPIPFLGLGVLLIKRACGPRKSWPDWLKPASCTVLLPLTSSPPTGQTTPALGHQLGGPTERKLCKALPRCLLHHVHRPPVLHPCGALCKAWPLSYKAGRDGAWGRCYGWLRGYLRRRDSGLGSFMVSPKEADGGHVWLWSSQGECQKKYPASTLYQEGFFCSDNCVGSSGRCAGLQDPQLRHHETSPGGPRCCVYHFPAATKAFNFERPCYLRGGICLKQGTPDCEPFRGPCRAFTVCCKVKGLWGRAAAEKP